MQRTPHCRAGKAPGEAHGISRCICTQAVGSPENAAPKWMTAENYTLELVIYQFGGRIVVTLYLVTYHLNLLVYLRLRITAMEDNIREQVDSLGKWSRSMAE